jgi:hypothetical protein
MLELARPLPNPESGYTFALQLLSLRKGKQYKVHLGAVTAVDNDLRYFHTYTLFHTACGQTYYGGVILVALGIQNLTCLSCQKYLQRVALSVLR